MVGGDKSSDYIKRRLVLFFPGFEPLGAEKHRQRFERAAQKSAPHYGAEIVCSQLNTSESGLPTFTTQASGDGWQTKTDIVIFDWSSILEEFEMRSVFMRFALGLRALITFMLNGTLWAYLKTSWRYGLFFFYPLILIIAACLAGWAAGSLIFYISNVFVSVVSGLALTAALLWLAAKKAHLLLMMDDWAFAASISGGFRTDSASLPYRFRIEFERLATGSRHDEVLVFAHSLGAVFAVDCLGAALAKNPDLQINFMTAGSSLMKIALHPNAKSLRESVKIILKSRTKWGDWQALTDVISFYGSNPATSLGITEGATPKTIKIKFRHMLSPLTYGKHKRNLFRTHRQFVLATETRYPYSFHLIASGPVPFGTILANNGLPAGNLSATKEWQS
jgi:hypothetical protein